MATSSPRSAAPIQWVVLSIPALVGIALFVGSVWKETLPELILPLLDHRADLLIAIGGIAMVEDAMCRAYGMGRLHYLPLWTGLATLSMGGILKIDGDGAGIVVISVTMVVLALPVLILTVPSFQFPPKRPAGRVFLASFTSLAVAVALTLLGVRVDLPDVGIAGVPLLDWCAAIAALVFVGTLLWTIYSHFETVLSTIFSGVASRQNGTSGQPPAIGYLNPEISGEFELYHIPRVRSIVTLSKRFSHRSDVYVTGNMPIRHRTSGKYLYAVADVMVALEAKHDKARDQWVSWREGKAPDVVIDIAKAGRDQEFVRAGLETYRKMGVAEYWLFDPSGRYFDQPMAGYQLMDGNYQRISVSEAPTGILRSHSKKLGVDFYIGPDAEVQMYDPSNGDRLT